MKCASIVILCALLLAGLAGAGGVAAGNISSGESELNVTLLDFGPVGDHGWTYEAHVGASKMAQKQSFVNLSERENAAGPGASQILREYARNGAKLIFCHSYNFIDAIKEVAPEYPDVIFMWGGGTEKPAPNAGVYYERIYEAQYLAGIVAGNMTKTEKIAFAAALPTSQVIIGINAFARGVASSNPRANVYVEWIGDWYAPEKERAVALSLISKGCDIITHWSDSDATGQTADEMGIYFISFGSDVGRFSPRVYLTGAVWNWEPIMTDIVESVHNGTWDSRPGQEWWYGLAEGGAELAPFGNQVPGHVRSFVVEKQTEIALKKLAIFPNIRDEELKTMYYLEGNVVGELPKS
ncbi:MAG: BMP family ABC transporter substrate-binding protein [Methanothrix sp.]|nr:BMP family ABC transporter substrate-binding protein [Methanothrix sp.]